MKFSLQFLDISTVFYEFYKFELISAYLTNSENVFLNCAQCWATNRPGLQPTRRGGLPRTADQKVVWALACGPV
jgi:hypothetical protein